MNMKKNNPIGVFDSGIGGLTVVKELRKLLKNEDILYLGDTARLPYGTKSEKVIMRYAVEDTEFLLSRDVKMVIVACHTASSVAAEKLQQIFQVPVIGMIEPGARAAVKSTKNKKIGVIGTSLTIKVGAYEKAIKKLMPEAEIIARSTPMFVPIVEEGWIEHPITDIVIKEYLTTMKEENIDTLLLGCTHYPLLAEKIQKFMGDKIMLINPSLETAIEAEYILKSMDMKKENGEGKIKIYLTDLSPNFETIGSAFLEEPINNVMKTTLRGWE